MILAIPPTRKPNKETKEIPDELHVVVEGRTVRAFRSEAAARAYALGGKIHRYVKEL